MEKKTYPVKNAYRFLIVILGWFAIILQLYLFMKGKSGSAFSLSLLNFFSYFTILTNILLAFGLTNSLVNPYTGWGKLFSKPSAETAVAVYIIIVGTIYYFFLMKLWNPRGLDLLADILMHKVVPILYFFYWIFFVKKGSLRWGLAIVWLIYPMIYFFYILIRGAIDGWYPYPFANVGKLGYAKAIENGILILASFYSLGILLIAVDKMIGGKGQAEESPLIE